MSKLGYTWYPKDWWTSKTFRKLRKRPILRYIYREIIDYLYSNGEPMLINPEEIDELFFVDISIDDLSILSQYFTITDEGLWWSDKIQLRLNRAEASRENGKKGGRPKKPRNLENNLDKKPEKPALEREREREIKEKVNTPRVYDGIIKKEHFIPPTKEEFIQLGIEKKKNVSKDALALKYDSQQEAGWINGNGEPISNWRAWLMASLTYLPVEKKEEQKPFIRTYKEYKG